jgi:hypothetical protein
MKKISILICLLLNTIIVFAQVNISLKNNETSGDYTIKIAPFQYADANCQSFDLKIKFTYTQADETLTAIITSKKTPPYDMIWLTCDTIYVQGQQSIKTHFKNKNQKVSLSKQFEKQTTQQQIIRIPPILCENCSLEKYDLRSRKYINQQIENEVFYLNGMELHLVFKVDKDKNPEIYLSPIIPVKVKHPFLSKKEKLEFQYVANTEPFLFKIKREPSDPCNFPEVISQIESINIHINEISDLCRKKKNAEKLRNKSEIESIKRQLHDYKTEIDDNRERLNGHPYANCDDLKSKIDNQTKLLNKCLGAIKDTTCGLHATDFTKAGEEIRILTNKRIVNELKTDEGFEKITKDYDNRIEEASASCRKKISKAIEFYRSFKKTYIDATKYKK